MLLPTVVLSRTLSYHSVQDTGWHLSVHHRSTKEEGVVRSLDEKKCSWAQRLVRLLGCALVGVVLSVTAATQAEAVDVVALQDGSVLYGEVVDMTGGKLRIKTKFGSDEMINVKWADVSKLTMGRSVPFHLKDGTTIMGKAESQEVGKVVVMADQLGQSVIIPLDLITDINPPIKKAVTNRGSFTAGLSGTEGNSRLKTGSFLGEFENRTDTTRFTLLGRYIYGDDHGKVITRNSRGTVKFDYFMSKRFYWFVSAYGEQDTFQDLKLRTAMSTGPGYQVIDRGDFESSYLKDLTLYGELGYSYFNEDFKIQADKSSSRLRWSIKADWPLVPGKITLYHNHEAFPSLQNSKDFYITSDQGVRMTVYKNLVTALQLTYRYNANPPPGTKSADTLYLINLGYSFDN